MEEKQWKYKIGSGKGPVIISCIMLVLFGGLTIWLHNMNNGAFIITGMFSAVMLLVLVATIYRFLFYKVLISKDGFYYQTGISNGKYYDYTEVENAWISSGTAMKGEKQDFCNISLLGGSVIRFQFFYNESKGVDYLIKRAKAAISSNQPNVSDDERTYLIDGKAFGKTRIVIAVVVLMILAVFDTVIIRVSGRMYLAIPGVIMAVAVLGYLIIDNLYFKIEIDKDNFYFRTNTFNGQRFKYNEIMHCCEIKKVVRFRSPGEADLLTYYFFFEFTDVRGKTYKFQFDKPIHEHEINVLKERIERNAKM